MEKIKTQNELYQKLKPALRTKRHELIAAGIKYIKENDIWNYHVEYWKSANGLTIATMVDEILNTPNELYENFVLEKINTEKED